MRTGIQERYYRTFMGLPVDRVPDIEFGYWPQTIRRWLREGLPLELTPAEQNQMFCRKLDDFFGFEPEGTGINLRLHMHPPFTEEILERKGDAVIMRDGSGAIAQRFLNDVEESSIPHYLRFPVERPADWEEMKRRFAWDEPTRALDEAELARARAAAPTRMVTVFFTGFYGQLRNWLGMENLSYAFYEQPAMVHDMVTHWAELCARQLERVPADLPIDHVSWWEDMASKNGPLCSPATFREFLQPGYRRVMSVARARGCHLAIVDCDGDPGALVPNWLEEGVNIMFPLEVAAGVDPYAWRERYGLELRLRGGVGKVPLVQGGSAIDRELDRLRPLLAQGRYIPHLDHLVPPDIPYAHYCQYLEKKRRLIGRG